MKRTSRLLIHEHPLQALPSLVMAVGLGRAIFLQQLHYWLLKPKAHVRVGDDGVERRWVHNTYEEWHEQFPFWEPESIRKLVSGLKRAGVVITTQAFNTDKRDRTQWYSIDYDALDSLLTVKDEGAEREAPGDHERGLGGGTEAGAEDFPHGPEKVPVQPEESTGSIYTETSYRDSALQAGHPPKAEKDEKDEKPARRSPEEEPEKEPAKPREARPMSPGAYCVKSLIERINAARKTGKRVEPLPKGKRGEYGDFYKAYLDDGREVEELERVLDRLVERASGRNGAWIRFGQAAEDVEIEYSGGGSAEAFDEPLHPQGAGADQAREKPRRPEWYAAMYGGSPEDYDSLIEQGLSHSAIEERANTWRDANGGDAGAEAHG